MIKMVDTAVPMNEDGYPIARAKHIWMDDNTDLETKLNSLGGGGGAEAYIELSQEEYDALGDEEKVNGSEYRTYDTGHIYKLGVEFGKETDISSKQDNLSQVKFTMRRNSSSEPRYCLIGSSDLSQNLLMCEPYRFQGIFGDGTTSVENKSIIDFMVSFREGVGNPDEVLSGFANSSKGFEFVDLVITTDETTNTAYAYVDFKTSGSVATGEITKPVLEAESYMDFAESFELTENYIGTLVCKMSDYAKIITNIDDEIANTDTVWSSKKTSDELEKKDDNANSFSLAGGDFVFEIALTDKKTNIEIVDNCGGKIEIYGNGTFDNYNNYKFIKVLRLSYGTWTTFDATTINDAYIKIKKVYIDNNKKCYVRVRGNANYIIKGTKSVEVKNLSDIDVAQLVEVPESRYTSINDTTSSTTSTYSSAKIDEKYGSLTLASEGSTQWLKLKLGTSSKFHPIVVSDQYGGKVEILGMANDGTYKSVKLVRHSYGDWTTHSATDYTTTTQGDANYKIRRLYYYPTDGSYYLEVRQWAIIKVEGSSTAEMVASLPVETSAMTLIPESAFASKDAFTTTNKRVQGATPFYEMYFAESRYKKLTVDLYYGREVTFSVNNLGYEGIISVYSSGDSASACTVKNIGVRGNPQGNISVKWGNFKSLGGSGHYQVDLFIFKVNANNTMIIRPRTQQVDGYSKIYTSADFVTSSQTEYEAA